MPLWRRKPPGFDSRMVTALLLRDPHDGPDPSGWEAIPSIAFDADGAGATLEVLGHWLVPASRTRVEGRFPFTRDAPVPDAAIASVLLMIRTNQAWLTDGRHETVVVDHDRPPHLYDLGFGKADGPRTQAHVVVDAGGPRLEPG